MITLAIEAANKSLSVALFHDRHVIASEHLENTLQHSVHLAPCVDRVMKATQMMLAQIEQIAVSTGPGSYTGLRIGVTFAKVLSQTLNIPIVPLSSLYILALSVQDEDACVIPFYDARRQNVFVGYYQNGKSIENDEHLSFERVLEKAKAYSRLIFISPDMSLYEESICQHFPHAVCINAFPSAKNMLSGQVDENISARELLPVYLKLAEAEENWQKTHDVVATNDLIERTNYS